MAEEEKVTLEFLARQQLRLLDEMNNLRRDVHEELAAFRDEMMVQTAVIMRVEGALNPILQQLRAMQSQMGRMDGRLRKIEEGTGVE